jgi:hypothetical protein
MSSEEGIKLGRERARSCIREFWVWRSRIGILILAATAVVMLLVDFLTELGPIFGFQPFAGFFEAPDFPCDGVAGGEGADEAAWQGFLRRIARTEMKRERGA